MCNCLEINIIHLTDSFYLHEHIELQTTLNSKTELFAGDKTLY